MNRPPKDGQSWTREELILAFELYCRIPFQRTKANEVRVKDLAALIGRTPGSVARKLGNFGAFDPQLASQDISGLTHGSKLDRIIWDEFYHDWGGLVLRAQEIRTHFGVDEFRETPLVQPTGPSERIVTAKQRLHQAFFREAVFSSYNSRCCITGLPIVECLSAGHIIPWSVNERRRADPTNGICLSGTFDRLFDFGLIAIKEDLTIQVSHRLLESNDRAVVELVAIRHGEKILPPNRFYPDPECLRWHLANVFKSI